MDDKPNLVQLGAWLAIGAILYAVRALRLYGQPSRVQNSLLLLAGLGAGVAGVAWWAGAPTWVLVTSVVVALAPITWWLTSRWLDYSGPPVGFIEGPAVEDPTAMEEGKWLSSPWTLWFKIALPVLSTTLFGVLMWRLFFDRESGADLKWALLVTLAIWPLTIRLALRMKRVRVGAGALLVSGFGNETPVPYGLVREVTQNIWTTPVRPVTVHLHEEVTGLGKSFTFQPPQPPSRLDSLSEDPVVVTIRMLADVPDRGA